MVNFCEEKKLGKPQNTSLGLLPVAMFFNVEQFLTLIKTRSGPLLCNVHCMS